MCVMSVQTLNSFEIIKEKQTSFMMKLFSAS